MSRPVSRTDGRFAAHDGTDLHYLAWTSDQPRAGLIITHGFTEHAARYEHVGERFARSSVSTYGFDLRGHGRSEGRRGDAPAFDSFLWDLAAFRRLLRGLAPGLPLFLLGHSMGGLIALRYLQEHPDEFAGAIVIAPWLGLASPPPRGLRLLARALAPVLPALPFPAGIKPEHLSRDEDVVRRYRADPLVHHRITPRLFTNIEDAIARVLESGDRVSGPLLLLLAGDDRIVDTPTASAFAARWSRGGLEVRLEDSAYHEILNEPDRAATLEAILGWILARVPMRQQNPGPS